MFHTCIIIFAAISAIYCTNVDNCELDNLPLNVQLNDCVEQPCTLKSGTPFEGNITFDAPYNIGKMETDIFVSLGGSPEFKYPYDQDTCAYLIRGWCPLENGERATYNLKLDLPPIPLPLSVKVKTKITVVDNNEKDEIVCFKVAIYVRP